MTSFLDWMVQPKISSFERYSARTVFFVNLVLQWFFAHIQSSICSPLITLLLLGMTAKFWNKAHMMNCKQKTATFDLLICIACLRLVKRIGGTQAQFTRPLSPRQSWLQQIQDLMIVGGKLATFWC